MAATRDAAFAERAAAAVAAQTAHVWADARKAGRIPTLPYVPIRRFADGHQEQILGWAFATRDEAVACAQRQLDAWRARTIDQLCRPEYRALREHFGLPRELEAR